MSSSLLLPLLLLGCSLFYGQCATISISPGGTAFQDALDEVNPGDVIELGHGDYWEDLKTRTDGTADMPITIRGAGGTNDRANVVLRGDGISSRVFEIKHDYYVVEDFTVDGDSEDDPNRNSDSDSAEDMWRDILIYAIADREPTERDGGYVSTLDGLVVRNMKLANAGGECIRLRDHVTYAEVHHNNITDCGIYDFRIYGDGKNGEGLYLGTSSNQWEDGPDVCKGNIIRDNYIRTRGNEGIEVKEGSVDTLIEYNEVHMQYDKESGGIGSRGDRSIIRYNHIQDTDGAGVRLGGHIVDGIEYGADNQVYGNTMVDCRHSAVKVMVDPQGQICDNEVILPDTDDEDEVSVECWVGDRRNPHSRIAAHFLSPKKGDGKRHGGTETAGTRQPCDLSARTRKRRVRAATASRASTAAASSAARWAVASARVRGVVLLALRTGFPLVHAAEEGSRIAATTGVAPCIYGSASEADGGGTCSDGIEGIDGNGVVCCPLDCTQCGGTGCTSAGAANGLDSGSCCGRSIKSSGNYCDDTGEAPCIYGSAPDSTCRNDLEGIDHKGEICCPLGCGQCGGSRCILLALRTVLAKSLAAYRGE
ncbi:unnamed protein product [Ectocarpus sp. 6 AP-2014]